MAVLSRGPTPYATPIAVGNRPILGVVLHDSETDGDVLPHPNGSWHYLVERDGTVYADVPEEWIAWHVRAADRWRPDWLPPSGAAVSDVNWATIGIEMVSSALWRDQGTPFTEEQYAALGALSADLDARYGGLWWVGHGELQTDRTDPVGFDWDRAGFGSREAGGRRLAWSATAPPADNADGTDWPALSPSAAPGGLFAQGLNPWLLLGAGAVLLVLLVGDN